MIMQNEALVALGLIAALDLGKGYEGWTACTIQTKLTMVMSYNGDCAKDVKS